MGAILNPLMEEFEFVFPTPIGNRRHEHGMLVIDFQNSVEEALLGVSRDDDRRVPAGGEGSLSRFKIEPCHVLCVNGVVALQAAGFQEGADAVIKADGPGCGLPKRLARSEKDNE